MPVTGATVHGPPHTVIDWFSTRGFKGTAASSLHVFKLSVRAWQRDAGEASSEPASCLLLDHLCDTVGTPLDPACYCVAVQANVFPAVQWLSAHDCATSSRHQVTVLGRNKTLFDCHIVGFATINIDTMMLIVKPKSGQHNHAIQIVVKS